MPGRPSDTSAARSANGPATATTRSGHANDHGLAFDAAELFLLAETNYQSSHPAGLPRAEIPGQFISDSWVGVTGPIDFTESQHIAGLPLAVVRIRISSPTATPTCKYLGQGQVFGLGPSTGPCPDGSD